MKIPGMNICSFDPYDNFNNPKNTKYANGMLVGEYISFGISQVTLDTSGAATGSGSSTLGVTLTIGSNSNRLLCVGVAANSNSPNTTPPTISSVKIGSTSFTQLSGATIASNGVGGQYNTRIYIFFLINPPTGSNTITATSSTSVDSIGMGVTSLYGCDQSIGMQSASVQYGLTSGSTTNLAITPTVIGSWIFSAISSNSNLGVATNVVDWSNGSNATPIIGQHNNTPTINSGNFIGWGNSTDNLKAWAIAGGEVLRF